ncbi:TlpA family protein disulfide reductase [Pedobacter sp. HDW13]|uniref:TlpA family protein disulfide reductase n=1 Tax=Pedobacter sp. HDW13 TaxID=2714940 RepID=UPI001409B803|nr:TlpA disulfide reductase family protein [Pedobacter sp. HDW13]QIL41210.1 TlpA family protein disulfide reductase [Pedobacter sp. HDW13]
MKKLTIFISLFFLSLSVFAQNNPDQEDYSTYFNGFQRTSSKYPDSAIVYMQKLAKTEPSAAEELIHNSFAQAFRGIDREKMRNNPDFLAMIKKMDMTIDSVFKAMGESKKNAYVILNALSNDANPLIRNTIFPLAKWVEAQGSITNTTRLLEIGNDYLKYLSDSTDFYTYRKARYGLLISKLMTGNSELKPISNKLLKLIYSNLQNYQKEEDTQTLTRPEMEKRAWYRYLFAYTNFISAQNTQSKNEKISFLKLASQFSPDVIDKTISHAYFYDRVFLLGEGKESFEEDYLAALGNGDEKFKGMMAMSMKDPSFKTKAKGLYKEPAKFNILWLYEFNNNFKTAPQFSLLQLNGVQYKLSNQKKQWTLVDFWGTWCTPCRKEHPDLQKLYLQTLNGQLPMLNIITIASDDREPVVSAYMKEFKYSFPVAMSDNQIEKAYNVSSWPSKFLISPQGKFVAIPSSVNWIKYVKDYIND